MANKKTPAGRARFTVESFNQVLRGWGLDPSKFTTLIREAIREKWTPEYFQAMIYQSDAFASSFPGIFDQDGAMVMNPSQYVQTRRTWQRYASQYGWNMTDADFGDVVGGSVSEQEFIDRLEAGARIEENPAFGRFMSQALPGQKLKTGDLFDTLMGTAPKQFYDAWEEANIRFGARQAGISINKDMADKIQKGTDSMSADEIDAHMVELAEKVRTVMPLSRLYKFGVSKSDLIQLEFGGPKRNAIRDRVEEILKQGDAFSSAPKARGGLTDQPSQNRAQVV